MALNKGENYAMHKLIKYLREYKTLGIKDSYRADLLVSCYSDKSRNKTFGKTFAKGEKYDDFSPASLGKTVEGLYTAQVIEKHNLFKSCPELRKITKKIS
jgi:glycerol-3-phosphate dehydrogenase